jgi:hypothetical protein
LPASVGFEIVPALNISCVVHPAPRSWRSMLASWNWLAATRTNARLPPIAATPVSSGVEIGVVACQPTPATYAA